MSKVLANVVGHDCSDAACEGPPERTVSMSAPQPCWRLHRAQPAPRATRIPLAGNVFHTHHLQNEAVDLLDPPERMRDDLRGTAGDLPAVPVDVARHEAPDPRTLFSGRWPGRSVQHSLATLRVVA